VFPGEAGLVVDLFFFSFVQSSGPLGGLCYTEGIECSVRWRAHRLPLLEQLFSFSGGGFFPVFPALFFLAGD
jgi:hypothetical protein